jgi:uncharacterized membrane protein YdjX (TVP38/TMEM64 family)
MTTGQRRALRLAGLALFVAVVLVVAEVTGLRHHLTVAKLRELTLSHGLLGVVYFTAAYIVGELIHVPGLLFVGAAVAIWGRVEGGVIAWGSSVLALAASFLVVRAIGGPALADIEHRWLQRVQARLEAQPIRTVALLRAVLVISPPVTYALALSRVRFVPFFLGSAIGLVPPMVLAAIFFQYLLRWLGA